jgi:hypothetical protein
MRIREHKFYKDGRGVIVGPMQEYSLEKDMDDHLYDLKTSWSYHVRDGSCCTKIGTKFNLVEEI